MDSLFLNNRVLNYIASIAMICLLSITAINASILNNQDINLNKTSSGNLDLNSFTQGAMISSEGYDWYGSITKSSNTSNNGTWQDFEYYDNQWNQEDTDNITIDVNSTGALFSFPDGFQMATRVVSTYQINSIGETSFSDLYISSVENTVVSSGSGWNDVNDWAPTYWDQENDTQVNVTTPQQLLTMYLVQNNWFSNDYAMLDGNVSDTSGNVVSGSWDGTSYYENCDEGDCRIIERTENVIGSWEFNGTAINVHLPKEYKTFSLVADQNSPTGFFVSEAGLDKVGSVWNDELLSGADATSQTVQTIFAAIQSAESTPVQNGFTAADINDKIYYVAYTNDDGNISLEKMSFGILNGDNNTTLDFNVSTYINGTLNHDEDFSIQAHLEDNGTITTMWYDQQNSCGGSDTYTLLDRNTSNDVATLRVSGSSVSNCDGEESDNWIDTWYLYNGTIIDGKAKAAIEAITNAGGTVSTSPSGIASTVIGKTYYEPYNETGVWKIDQLVFDENGTNGTGYDLQDTPPAAWPFTYETGENNLTINTLEPDSWTYNFTKDNGIYLEGSVSYIEDSQLVTNDTVLFKNLSDAHAYANSNGTLLPDSTSGLVCDYDYVSTLGDVYLVDATGGFGVISYPSDSTNHTRTFTYGSFTHDGTMQTEAYTISENNQMMFFTGNNSLGDYNISVIDMNVSGEYNNIMINTSTPKGSFAARIYFDRAVAEAYVNSLNEITPISTADLQNIASNYSTVVFYFDTNYTAQQTEEELNAQSYIAEAKVFYINEGTNCESLNFTNLKESGEFGRAYEDDNRVCNEYNVSASMDMYGENYIVELINRSDSNTSSGTDDGTVESKFAGKTFYTLNQAGDGIEGWSFASNMEQITFTNDGISDEIDNIVELDSTSFCIVNPGEACGSTDRLTVIDESSNVITVNIDNENISLFTSLDLAKAHYGFVTTYNAFGYTWTDEKKDSRYTLDGNYVEFNSTDEWFQLRAMEDNNTKSRAEIKANIENQNGLGTVIKVKSGAINGGAHFRLYTWSDYLTIPNDIPSDDNFEIKINPNTAFSTAVIKATKNQLKARVYVEDENGNYATIFDENITSYVSEQFLDTPLKLLIKVEDSDRIMFKALNPENNNTIGEVIWYDSSDNVTINGFQKVKLRSQTDATPNQARSDKGMKFNVYNVFALTDSSTSPDSGDDSKFDKNNTLAFPDTYFDNKKYFSVEADQGDVEFFQATFSSNGGFLSTDYEVNSANELVLDGNGSGNWTRVSDKVINLLDSWSNEYESCDSNTTLYLLEDNTSSDPAFIKIGGNSNEVCVRNGKTETYSDEWVEKLYVGDVTTLSTTQIAAMVEEVNQNKYDNEMNYPFQIVGTTNIPAGYEDANINLEAQPILTNHNEWRGIAISSSAGTNDFILGVENVKFILRAHINTPNGHSEYIYDKASDKWLNGQEVNWVPVDENGNEITNPDGGNYNHIPDVEILDSSDFNGSNQLGVDFDLVAIENSTFRIIGQVITASDYSPMTYCTNDYSSMNVGRCEWDGGENGYRYHVGENAINIEFMDMSTGQHMGWTRLENGTENNGSQLFNTVTKFSSEGNYTARLNINTYDTETGQSTYEGYYINPTDGSLISDQLVEWAESNVTDNNGYKMWMPNLSAEYVIQVKDRDGNRTSNYATVNFLEKDANQFKLNGRLTSTDGMTTYIELIDVSNGRYFGWTEIKNGHGDFNISLKNEEAEYIVRINKSSENKWESYYYDVNETDLSKSKFVIDNGINWNDIGDGVWLPDTNKTGTLRIYDIDSSGDVTKDDVPTLDINFADMDSQFYTIEGNVTVASNFEFGEKRDSNDNWVGYSNIGLEITDTEGRWVAWKDISNDDQCTDNGVDTKTCQYKIRLSEADDYILRINKNKYVDGSMEYKGFYIDTNGDLISDRKVPFVDTNIQTDWGGTYWAPDTNVVKVYTLNDSTNNIVQNINFVEHANSTYKLEGIIKLPDGFDLDNNSETYSMIRVEALNADTGEWLGDGKVSMDHNGTVGWHSYSVVLDGATSETNIIVKLIIEENTANGSDYSGYFIDFGDNNLTEGGESLISENNVNYKKVEVPGQSWDNWVPDIESIPLAGPTNVAVPPLDLPPLLEFPGLTGTIALASSTTLGWSDNGYWNYIGVEAIDATTGRWAGYTEAYEDENGDIKYNLELQADANYTMKIVLNIDGVWESYFINFGADHAADGTDADADTLVSEHKVEWIKTEETDHYGNNIWYPNPEQAGFITLNSKVTKDIDFATYESSVKKLTGIITPPAGFEIGDKYGVNGQWIGRNSIRVEAINKLTGEHVGVAEISSADLNTSNGTYNYKLMMNGADDSDELFVIKIVQEEGTSNSLEYKEYYYNFTSSEFINGNTVRWVEAQDAAAGQNWKNWMPNPNQTGWLDFSGGTEKVQDFDLAGLVDSEITIGGNVVLPSDHNLSLDGYFASVNAIDANDGRWLGDTQVAENGDFNLSLGVVENIDVILQVHYSYYNHNDYANSYWKNKYVDFGEDNAEGGSDEDADSVKGENQVQWVAKKVSGQDWDIWVPNVNHLAVVTSDITDISIDTTTPFGNTIEGTISGLSNISNPYVSITAPGNYGIWRELKASGDDYTFRVEELNDMNYTVEVGFEKDGQFFNYFLDNNGTHDYLKDASDVEWADVDVNGETNWGPKLDSVKYVSGNQNLSIVYVAVNYNTVTVNIDSLESGKDVSLNFFIPNKNFGMWENKQVSVNDNISFELSGNIKDGNEYILSFYYDGNEYTCDGANCNKLRKNVQWIAKDSDDNTICGGDIGWDCDWSNSHTWKWTPDVEPLDIKNNPTITPEMPSLNAITGNIKLGTDFANKYVWLNIFSNEADEYVYGEIELDANGDGNLSTKVSDGNDYRIELWIDGLGGYVFSNNNTPSDTNDDKWITQHNSWDTTNWQPLPETLIDISADLPLGDIELTSGLSTVTVLLENLKPNEEVWVSLESDTKGYFGESNANWDEQPVIYDSNVTFKVPDSNDYKLMVFPTEHKGGYASNGNGIDDENIIEANTTGWDEYDYFKVQGDSTFTVTFPAADTLGDVNGTVNCGTADCSGWLTIFNTTEAKGTNVDVNGLFKISGLSAGDYDITYWSDDGNLTLDANVTVVANDIVTVTIEKDTFNMFESITGTITANDLTGIFAVLIETDGSDYEVIDTVDLDDSGNFEFGAMTKTPSGKALYVAAAKGTKNDDYSTTVKFDDAVEVHDAADTISLPSIPTENFATSLNATANNF